MQPEIGELERVAALAWRAPEEERLGGWLLRAASGFTGRANSALAIGDPGLPVAEAVHAVRHWYEAHGLPPMIAVPHPLRGPGWCGLDLFLDGRGWRIRTDPAVVMTAGIADVAHRMRSAAGTAGEPKLTGGANLEEEPDDAWLALYNYRGRPSPPIARQLLLSAPAQIFATIRDGGMAVAIGRLALASGWGGLTAIEVRAEYRRRGLGAAITSALTVAAAQRGATRMYLQVEEGNTAAMALYTRCGFAGHHRYHYRVATS